MEKNLKTSSFIALGQQELFDVDGGDPARNKMVQELRSSGGVRYTEEEKRLVVGYTLGYLSLATAWSLPIGAAFGLASTLYSCN